LTAGLIAAAIVAAIIFAAIIVAMIFLVPGATVAPTPTPTV